MEQPFIERRFKAIEQRQDEHQQRIDDLQKDGIEKFHELRLYASKTQGLVEDQMQEMRDFRSHVDVQFNRADQRITDLHKDVAELELAMRDVRKTQAEHSKKFDEHSSKLDEVAEMQKQILVLLQKRQ